MSLNSSEFKTASTFLDTLKREVAKMQAMHPDREGELARAHALILHGMVVPSADDPAMGQVLSSDAQTVYRVNGTCSCRAGEHGTMCKHRQAWQLYQYIAGKVEAQPTPEGLTANDTPPPPLYEAAASVNVRLLIDGRDCQLTLRDGDEGRLLQRLQVVLRQYPAPHPVVETARQGEGWCAVHNVQMKLNTGKDGRTWYSHKTAEGTFCKGK